MIKKISGVSLALNAATQAILDDISKYPRGFETVRNNAARSVNKISK